MTDYGLEFYWDFVPPLDSLLSTLVLWTTLALILFVSLDFCKEFIWDILTVSIEFNLYAVKESSPVAYSQLVLDYITQFAGANQDSSLFQTSSHITPAFSKNDENEQSEEEIVQVKALPPYGTTFFKYKGVLFRVRRRVPPKIQTYENSISYFKISTFKWKAEVLEKCIDEAIAAHYTRRSANSKTTIYAIDSRWGEWRKLGNSKVPRSAASICLANHQAETIIRDVGSFFTSRKWYAERGVPHHRGYLLYGPPGSGKTSVVRAVAGEFKRGISSLSLNSEGLTDDGLIYFLNKTPSSILLIEDIDCAFKPRNYGMDPTGETNVALGGRTGSSVTFRGLLNALDGVASAEGKIVFMTTNHPEKLDPALIRPGRVDVKLFLDYPDDEQLGRYFATFFPESNTDKLKRKFIRALKMEAGDRKVSIAMVQGLFMLHKENAQGAIDGAKKYLEEQFKILPKLNNPNPNLYF